MRLELRLKMPLFAATKKGGRGPERALAVARTQQLRTSRWSDISLRQEMSEVTWDMMLVDFVALTRFTSTFWNYKKKSLKLTILLPGGLDRMNFRMSSTTTWFTTPNKTKMKARMKLGSSAAMEKTVASDGSELLFSARTKLQYNTHFSTLTE